MITSSARHVPRARWGTKNTDPGERGRHSRTDVTRITKEEDRALQRGALRVDRNQRVEGRVRTLVPYLGWDLPEARPLLLAPTFKDGVECCGFQAFFTAAAFFLQTKSYLAAQQ